MINESNAPGEICKIHPCKHISWTAIFVGALVGVGLGFLLNLFGIAIGLSTFTLNKDGASVLAIGGLIGVVIGIVAAMITAGFAAGYLGRWCCPKRNLGILYGFTTWTVALLLSAIITAHVGNYVSSYSNNLTHSLVVVPENSANNVESVTMENTNKGNEQPKNNIKVVASPSSLAWSAFLIFALFFIGALSSCVGAHWGMTCHHIE